MTATFKTCNITHLLIVCPRGFANERSVYAVPADLLADAEKFEQSVNREGHCDRTRVWPVDDCCNSDRREAGRRLSHFADPEEYREFLTGPDSPWVTIYEWAWVNDPDKALREHFERLASERAAAPAETGVGARKQVAW